MPGAGYGDVKQVREYRALKFRVDSIETELKNKEQQFDNIKKVLQGNVPKLDTNKLELPKTETSND